MFPFYSDVMEEKREDPDNNLSEAILVQKTKCNGAV